MRSADGNSTILCCFCCFVVCVFFLWLLLVVTKRISYNITSGPWMCYMHWMLNKFTFLRFFALSFCFSLSLPLSSIFTRCIIIWQYKNCRHTTQIIIYVCACMRVCDLIRSISFSFSHSLFIECSFRFVYIWMLFNAKRKKICHDLTHSHCNSHCIFRLITSARDRVWHTTSTRANKPCNSLF